MAKPQAPTSPYMEIGSTGLRKFGGRVDNEWLPQLKGRRGQRQYREMADNSSIIGAYLYAFDSLVRGVSWNIVSKGTTDEHKKWRDHLESCMSDMSHTWDDFISEALSMLVFGWAYFNVVYKVRSGSPVSRHNDRRIGWRKFSLRGQESLDRWEFDEQGELLGMWQQDEDHGTVTFIPLQNAIHFRTRSDKNSPEGRSILRTAYRDWHFLKNLQDIEAIGIERNVAGLPVMEVPPRLMSPNASTAEASIRADIEKMIQGVRLDEYMGLVIPAETDETGNPTGFKFRLQTTGGNKPADVDPVIKRYETSISRSVLAEFLIQGTGDVGAYASTKAKNNLFATALQALLENMTSTINRFAVQPLMELNRVPSEFWPRFEPSDITAPNATELAEYVNRISGVISKSPELEAELLRRGNLPLPDRTRTNAATATPGEDATRTGIQPFNRTPAGGEPGSMAEEPNDAE